MTPRRRWLVFSSLLTATLVAAVWVNEREAEQASVVVAKPRRATAQADKPSNQLALEKLQRAPAAEEETVSNLFPSKSWYVPPPPPKPVPPPPPAPPPLPFKYMGKLVDEGKITVFLASQDRNFSVSQGDTLDGKYRIDTVDAQRVVLTYLPLDMQQTLIIGGGN